MSLVAFDFETDPIDSRPNFPPKPVGLAILHDGGLPIYLAWGHPTKNNCLLENALPLIKDLFEKPSYELIAHNLAFDAAVAMEKLGMVIPWDRCHDTMLMAFLNDPFAELGLKELADKHFGEAPVEQDAVRDWLIRNGVVRANDKQWGAHIGKAPGDLVGVYAKADVRKTLDLYKFLKPKLEARDAIRI